MRFKEIAAARQRASGALVSWQQRCSGLRRRSASPCTCQQISRTSSSAEPPNPPAEAVEVVRADVVTPELDCTALYKRGTRVPPAHA